MPRVHALVTVVAILSLLAACRGDAPTAPACSDTSGRGVAVDCLSDRALFAQIVDVGGEVMIGFREAGALRGVSVTGQNVTRPETRARMTALLQEAGVQIRWQAQHTPAVAGVMPLDRALVTALRRHPNVDYLEPVGRGTLLGR